ncbi:hypothetical protein N473_17755 [Pseudoalteromonas luteoviolacea CPMOR-1]|uniref:Multidrug transporter MatE n=1 Tax=Pseudoalteromonas luteoviolacea CPMOR-1 TaxID=1365248 RepID=A0A167KU46_9GAMM|nr:MATE family efflux transporter [Pseudoalteromonas luteoviolacea]KZN63274.1 hypothetical protein N473_17755 [Pseudoalteromonas luteoviolacea CPMOR-1]
MSENTLDKAVPNETTLVNACCLIIKNYFPILLTFLSSLLLFTIDRISLSNYSETVLAASGPATYTSMVLLTLFTTGIAYTRTKVAIANGQGEQKTIESEISTSIASSLIISLIVIAVGSLAYFIPDFSSRDIATVQEEKAYLLFFPLFGFFAAINSCFSSILVALLKSKFVLYVSLVEHALNAALTVSLVYGLWFLPELGIKGAAIGTAIALAVSTCLYVILLLQNRLVSYQEIKSVSSSQIRSFFSHAIPLSASGVSRVIGNACFVWLVGSVSTAVLISNNILVAINYIFVIPIVALGIAINAVVANEIGKDKNTSVFLNASILVGTLYLFITYLIISNCDKFLFDLFTPSNINQSLVSIFNESLLPMASYIIAFCYSTIFAKHLESYKKNKFVFKVRLYISTIFNITTLYLFLKLFSDTGNLLSTAWYLGAAFEALAAIILYIYIIKIRRG